MLSIHPGKLIEFTTPDKLYLHGFLTPVKSKACIVYVHGMTGSFYRHNLAWAVAKESSRAGVACFLINTRGHDAIAKINGVNNKRKLLGTNLERFEECILDIKGAITALKTLGFTDFYLAGHSTGCHKITYYQYKTKDRSVKGLILLAPADDYNVQRRDLSRKFSKTVSMCERMIKQKKGNETHKDIPSGFSAQRFLSVTSLKRVEARLFNYDGAMKEFSAIDVPILAVFGSQEEYAAKHVEEYLDILKSRNPKCVRALIKNADHGFNGFERHTAEVVTKWIQAYL